MKGVIVVAGGDAERILLLGASLEPHSYAVTYCRSIPEFNAAIKEAKPTAILLLYPDDNGLIEALYNNGILAVANNATPVIVISSSRQDNDRARSLRYKADEFLIEPIASIDLLTIIEQTVSTFAQTSTRSVLSFGDLVLDRTSLIVSLRDVTLSLDPVHARILEFLMLKPGRAFTRREISNGVWGVDNSVDDRAIDVFVGRIRDALKHKVTVDPIRTIRNIGYAFNEQFAKIDSRPKKGGVMKRDL